MTYKLDWLVPDRVIELTCPEFLSEEVLEAFDFETKAMLDAATQTVHIMVDLRPVKQTPSIQTALKRGYYRHPQMGMFLVIGLTANPILRFISGMLGRMTGIGFKDFVSREQAIAYLKNIEHIQTEQA